MNGLKLIKFIKMKIYILFIFFLPTFLAGQGKVGIQVREGLVTIDQIKARIDPVGIYQDIAFKTEVFASYLYEVSEDGNLSVGLGFSYLDFFGVSDPSLTYLATRISYDHGLGRYGFTLGGEIDTYIFASNDLKHALHKKVYSNFLLKIGKKIGKHFKFDVGTPLSILPIYRGKIGVLDNGEFVETSVRAEELGIYLALEYRF